MATRITLTGDYGYTSYRYNGGDAISIDATAATWIVANTGTQTNLYPFLVDNASTGIEIFGATVIGEVSQTADWIDAYINSAAIMVRDTQGASLYDMRITEAWDAIRIAGRSDGFEISNVWVSDTRDDAVENDDASSGVIRNSLFDGVFSGISLGNKNTPDSTNEVVEIDNVLLRMESYLYKGQMTHGSPFKMQSTSPMLRITDSVIAIEDVNHIGDWRLDLAWDKTIESSGNVFLNLSDTPLPSDYPAPPSGWTVLEGQAARDYWAEASAAWIESHEGGDVPIVDTGIEAPDIADPLPEEVAIEPETVVVTSTEPTTEPTTEPIYVSKIMLDSDVLTSLVTGPNGEPRLLDKAHFEIGGRADDPDDYILYKWETGALYYDADGSGSGKQIQIAQLDKRQALDHTDFLVTSSAGATVGSTAWAGNDIYLVDNLPDANDTVPTISDFVPGSDKITLDGSVFTSLGIEDEQVLDEAHFEIAARADDQDDYLMYKWRTGELFYDADGSRSGEAVQIAQLDPYLSLDHSDFLVV